MAQEHVKLVCVLDRDLEGPLKRKLQEWGWSCVCVLQPEEAPLSGRVNLLPPSESRLEEWGRAAAAQIDSETKPLLLVQAELGPGDRSALRGVLVAERVWCERVVPTVIATFNPRPETGARYERIRSASADPLLKLVHIGDELTPAPSLVLWDILSSPDDLSEAINYAQQTVERLQDPASVSERLSDALAAAQTASYRHRLKGLMASLRIMEGAYRHGWLEPSDVDEMIDHLKSFPQDAEYGPILDNIREATKGFKAREEWRGQRPAQDQLNILVCDDDWERSGWSRLVPKLCDRLFGLHVRGYTSVSDLQHSLGSIHREAAAVLLDVHYEEDGREVKKLSKGDLQRLQQQYPLLDIILFTSDEGEGLLVREAYERGYRIFYKEIDEPTRDPKTYADKFVKAIEQSVRGLPVRGLSQVLEVGVDGQPQVHDAVKKAQENLMIWRLHPGVTTVFGFVPLLEDMFRDFYKRIFPKKSIPLSGVNVNWWKATQEVRASNYYSQDTAFRIWEGMRDPALLARNALAHNANLVLESTSPLPSLGLALTILTAILTLQKLITGPQNNAVWTGKMKSALQSFAETLVTSNQAKKVEVQALLRETVCACTDATTSRLLVQKVWSLVNDNKETFERESADKVGHDLNDQINDLRLATRDKRSYSLSAAELARVLLAVCLLDGDYTNLK